MGNRDYGLYLYTSILNLFTFVCEIGATDPSEGTYDPILIDPIRVWVAENYSALKSMTLQIKDHAPRIGTTIGSIGESAILLESISTMNALNKHYTMARKEEYYSGAAVRLDSHNLKGAFEETVLSDNSPPFVRPPRRGSVDLLNSDGVADEVEEDQPIGLVQQPASNTSQGDPELVNYVITKIPEFLVRTDINTRYATLSCIAKLVKSNKSIQLPMALIQSIVDMLVPTAWQKCDGNGHGRGSAALDEDAAIIADDNG